MPETQKPLTPDEAATLEEEIAEVRLSQSQIMSIRINDRELRLLAAAASRAGLKVSTFVKRAALEAAEVGSLDNRPSVQFGVAGTGYAFTGFNAQLRDAGSPTGVEIRFTAGQPHVTFASSSGG